MTPPLNQAAYHSTFRAVSNALATTDPIVVAAAALRYVGESVDGFHQLSGATVDCRAGCSFCCWLRIDVRAHEVLLIARHLRAESRAAQLAPTRDRITQAAARVTNITYAQRHTVHQPCALLDHAGCCTVYDVRPAACRRYLSVSVDACEAIWQGEPPATEPENPAIAEPGRFAASGAHNAFLAAGFDGYSYDLMAALAEAMDDPECEARWRLKQPAFSEKSRSTVPDGFSQEEAVARLYAELTAASS